MFGLGDSNKSKLEENMEEIKDMVNGSEQAEAQEGQPENDFKQSFGETAPGENDADLSNSFDSPEPANQPPQEAAQRENEEDTEQKLQEEIEKFESEKSSSMQNQRQKQNAEEPKQQEVEGKRENIREGEQDRSRRETVDRGRDQQKVSGKEAMQSQEGKERGKTSGANIPEPAKTRDLDVPEIDKGPLFITRQKFETATRLIYEMRNLSNEIESTVEAMEQDIKRDRETEQQVQTILNEFRQDRKDVESIISPK